MPTAQCRLTFIGTATVLLELGPFTLLTDPNFLHRGQRAYLGLGLTSTRRTEPALSVGDLPALDAIVLSHMHGDHWDRVGKRELPHDLPIFTTPASARALRRQRFTDPRPLTTWQDARLERDGYRLRITATPGRHAVGLARHVLPPVMGSVLDLAGPDGPILRLYISGDTLLVDNLRAIPERFPDIDAAVFHLGGTTLPGGFVVTMDATQGADLLDLVRPGLVVPVHHDDYGVFKSPLTDFLDEAERRGTRGVVRVVEPGATTDLLA
ncbi:MBL fold metallo-hydrolase [uncultured Jatrophihabitans sp.]|uniref:MBL fold metallo-hydrolase n=1 Tax=uncultured Jatrophihabitans sp. TaxID=1610747 RepID=UPI0035CBC8CE